MINFYFTTILLFSSLFVNAQQPDPILIKRLNQYQGFEINDVRPIYGSKLAATLMKQVNYVDSAEFVYLEIDSLGSITKTNKFKLPSKYDYPLLYLNCLLNDQNNIVISYRTVGDKSVLKYYDNSFNFIDSMSIDTTMGNLVIKDREVFIERPYNFNGDTNGLEILHLNKNLVWDSYYIEKIDSLMSNSITNYKVINDSLFAIGSNIIGGNIMGYYSSYDFFAVVPVNSSINNYFSLNHLSTINDFTIDQNNIINFYAKETDSSQFYIPDIYKPYHYQIDKQMNFISSQSIDENYYGHYWPVYTFDTMFQNNPICCSPLAGVPQSNNKLTFSIYKTSTLSTSFDDLLFYSNFNSAPYSAMDEHLGVYGSEGYNTYFQHFLDQENLYLVMAEVIDIPLILRFDIGLDRKYMPSLIAAPITINEINASIYPNPSKGVATIQFDEEITGSIKLVNITGSIVINEQLIDKSSYQLNLQNLPSGYYIYQIVSDNSKKVNGVIIKE